MTKEYFKGNRERLYAQMKNNSLLVLFSGMEVRKTNDEFYPFYTNRNFLYLTGRKKNLIITKNGENVSPEELENILSTNRLVGEILVREKNGVIEAEIYPDQDYVKKKRIKDVRAALQDMIDAYNKTAAPQKKIYSLVVRDTEFEKTTTRKIKRF